MNRATTALTRTDGDGGGGGWLRWCEDLVLVSCQSPEPIHRASICLTSLVNASAACSPTVSCNLMKFPGCQTGTPAAQASGGLRGPSCSPGPGRDGVGAKKLRDRISSSSCSESRAKMSGSYLMRLV